MMPKKVLRKLCLDTLSGVGDKLRQWEEWTGRAYHVRRRLRAEEQRIVGPAIDCRSAADAIARFEAARHVLPCRAVALALEELGLPPA